MSEVGGSMGCDKGVLTTAWTGFTRKTGVNQQMTFMPIHWGGCDSITALLRHFVGTGH